MLGINHEAKHMKGKPSNRKPTTKRKTPGRAQKKAWPVRPHQKMPEERAIIARLYEQTRGKPFTEARKVLRSGLKSMPARAIRAMVFEDNYAVKRGRKTIYFGGGEIWEDPGLLRLVQKSGHYNLSKSELYAMSELIELYKMAGSSYYDFQADLAKTGHRQIQSPY